MDRKSRKNSHPLRNASQAVFLFSIATTLARRWDTEQNSTSARLGRVQRSHTAYPRRTFSRWRKTHSHICNVSKDTMQEAFILKLRKMSCQVNQEKVYLNSYSTDMTVISTHPSTPESPPSPQPTYLPMKSCQFHLLVNLVPVLPQALHYPTAAFRSRVGHSSSGHIFLCLPISTPDPH